jgi:hypothetical protein
VVPLTRTRRQNDLEAAAWARVWRVTTGQTVPRRVEEVHKGLAGLRAADAGRLLDATYGLSWGLNRLVEVQKGVPLAGDVDWSPDWFERAEQVVGPRSAWARLRRRAFGVAADAPPTLRERVVAGLRLCVATAELLADVWTPPGDELIAYAVRLVRGALADEPGA